MDIAKRPRPLRARVGMPGPNIRLLYATPGSMVEQRGRSEAHHPREQVREEAGGLAQGRALGLHTSELLEECEGEDFRV